MNSAPILGHSVKVKSDITELLCGDISRCNFVTHNSMTLKIVSRRTHNNYSYILTVAEKYIKIILNGLVYSVE